ncbi:hypothetical protein NPIL_303802 [Nephila pilipes]|uniref:Uncharacterized protein n=1 Tax=Nephila pilipes TaxID=299642 RepID=A0A8X6N8Z9_NEPPI|nr:hypothetical protein NPIL_303802 [Nephila pilipes]
MIYMPSSTAVVQPDGGKPEIHQDLGENALIPPLRGEADLLTGIILWHFGLYFPICARKGFTEAAIISQCGFWSNLDFKQYDLPEYSYRVVDFNTARQSLITENIAAITLQYTNLWQTRKGPTLSGRKWESLGFNAELTNDTRGDHLSMEAMACESGAQNALSSLYIYGPSFQKGSGGILTPEEPHYTGWLIFIRAVQKCSEATSLGSLWSEND